MSNDLKVYDCTEVTIVFAGINVDRGFAENSLVKAVRNAEGFKIKVGADGEVTRSKTNNKTGIVTFSLMQTSAINAALSALYILDENAPNGAGVGALLIRDRQGSSLHTSAKCWIKKLPDTEYAAEATERTWEIECADLNGFIGGN